MRVEKVSLQDWNKLSEDAHKVAFGEARPKELNTFDFALVCFNEDQILGYVTVIEMDKNTGYIQHGGAMPGVKGTTTSRIVYHKIISWMREHYKRISTRIENKNVVMLKFAMSEGLLIHGCDLYSGEIFLHLQWGFN